MVNSSKFIVANWKMNGCFKSVQEAVTHYSNHISTNRDNVILAIPYPYLSIASHMMGEYNSKFNLGAQNVSNFDGYGALTGEVSANMLIDCKCSYVIIGHSERRHVLHDDEKQIKTKIMHVLNNQMIPILCVGEQLSERAGNRYEEVLLSQLEIMSHIALKELIIAYEPVWSIGTGETPTLEQISDTIKFIKTYMQNICPRATISVLYGGSVNAGNASSILKLPYINGLLVGGASLLLDEFTTICSMV